MNLKGGLRKSLHGILDVLFPPVCHLCREIIPDAGELHLCIDCQQGIIPVASPRCTCCGTPFVSSEQDDHLCGNCSITAPHFAAARASHRFEGGIQELVHRFKYGKRVQLRRPLALLMMAQLSDQVRQWSPELIIPVPLHDSRLRWRGFNQALLVGELLASNWQILLERDILRRERKTLEQTTLTGAERMKNVRGAFAVADSTVIRGKRVLLVDDVYTTGSTVGECARVLKKNGAEGVYVVTAARTV